MVHNPTLLVCFLRLSKMLTFRIYKSLLFLVANQIPALFGGGSCCWVPVLHPLCYTCKPAGPLRAVFFLAFLLSICFVFLPSLSRFRFWRRFFILLSFSCGFGAVSSVLVSDATRLAYHTHLIRTRISPFYFVWGITGTIFNSFSYCVLCLHFFPFC